MLTRTPESNNGAAANPQPRRALFTEFAQKLRIRRRPAPGSAHCRCDSLMDGKRVGQWPRRATRRPLGYGLMAMMPSISTDMPFGNDPIPTAERACLPASPNTSTNRSEQPLITLG